jgi:hypothetical protein
MQDVARLLLMRFMNFLSLRSEKCHTMESRVLEDIQYLVSGRGACTWLAVQLSFVYVELQQRHKAHCLAFPV